MVLLRSVIDTSLSASSSFAEPANVIGLPGATVIGCVAVGGTITVGSEMDTVGGCAVLGDDPAPVGGVEVGLARGVPSPGPGPTTRPRRAR